MKKKHLLATAAMAGLVLTPLGVMPAADAAGTGTFTVHVDDWETGADLNGIQLTLYSTATGATLGTKDTVGGEATFTDLDNGSYTVKAHDPAGKHADKFSRARTISDDGSEVDDFIGMPATTVEVGDIGGTVRQTTNELNAIVEIYPATATEASIESGAVQRITWTQANAYSDDYATEDLASSWSVRIPAGVDYKVRISDARSRTAYCSYWDNNDSRNCRYGTQAWVGGADDTAATAITAQSGKKVATGIVRLAGADAVPHPDHVVGTVTGTGGLRLRDVDVVLLQQFQHDAQTSWQFVSSTMTRDDGTFDLADGMSYAWDDEDGAWQSGDYGPLGAGTYAVAFIDERREYDARWFGGAVLDLDSEDAPTPTTTFNLGASATATANITLPKLPVTNTSGAFGVVVDDAGKSHEAELAFYDQLGNVVSWIDTRRDGSWSAPTTELPPGQYKVGVQSDNTVAEGWYGGKNFRTAKTYTVPVTGTVNVGSSALTRYAVLSGKITLPAMPGTDESYKEVFLRNANGTTVRDLELDDDGTFSMSVLPGTYYLSAVGSADWSFDLTRYRDASSVSFIEQFWKGRYTLASATPITVGSGAKVAGLNMTLGNKLLATAAPRIVGTPKIGTVLRAGVGTWNVTNDLGYSYVWKRGASVVSTAAAYTPTKADAGKVLTLTVTAKDTTATYTSGSAVAPAVKVPAPPKKKPKKHRMH